MTSRIRDARERDGITAFEEAPGRDGSKRDAHALVTPHGCEELVADVRAGVSASQMVDRKVLATLGSCNPGFAAQASGGVGNLRRVPGA